VPAVSEASVIWKVPEVVPDVIIIPSRLPQWLSDVVAKPVEAAFCVDLAPHVLMAAVVRALDASIRIMLSVRLAGHATPGLAPTVIVAVRSRKYPKIMYVLFIAGVKLKLVTLVLVANEVTKSASNLMTVHWSVPGMP
jgi:hypothetical protein